MLGCLFSQWCHDEKIGSWALRIGRTLLPPDGDSRKRVIEKWSRSTSPRSYYVLGICSS
jgi:hypothetical protein